MQSLGQFSSRGADFIAFYDDLATNLAQAGIVKVNEAEAMDFFTTRSTKSAVSAMNSALGLRFFFIFFSLACRKKTFGVKTDRLELNFVTAQVFCQKSSLLHMHEASANIFLVAIGSVTVWLAINLKPVINANICDVQIFPDTSRFILTSGRKTFTRMTFSIKRRRFSVKFHFSRDLFLSPDRASRVRLLFDPVVHLRAK